MERKKPDEILPVKVESPFIKSSCPYIDSELVLRQQLDAKKKLPA